MTIIRKLIKTDGTETDLPAKVSRQEIVKLIGAETLDSFMLKDRKHVALVDDLGHLKGLPFNKKATAMYWERCGGEVDHVVVGDVVVVPDSDFA